MTATTITYRKTKSGQWVAFGPEGLVHPGPVTITKRDGTTKTEYVERVGKTFDCGGIKARYGYLAERPRRRSNSRYVCNSFLDEGDGECMCCGHHHSEH